MIALAQWILLELLLLYFMSSWGKGDTKGLIYSFLELRKRLSILVLVQQLLHFPPKFDCRITFASRNRFLSWKWNCFLFKSDKYCYHCLIKLDKINSILHNTTTPVLLTYCFTVVFHSIHMRNNIFNILILLPPAIISLPNYLNKQSNNI